MASLDLSAAFDVINVNLLMERLTVLGLPEDVLSLIEIWLKDRMYYVEIDGEVSKFYNITHGTIQGSILGPILCAIYVSPIFDVTNLSDFADDNYALTWCKNIENTIALMSDKLQLVINWLTDSGLKVYESKTELCLFYRKDTPPIEITINNVTVKSSKTINVLGVMFDHKLTWSNHISNQINKANRALHAIRIKKKVFQSKRDIDIADIKLLFHPVLQQ